jgi:hypothetical protein
MRLRFFSAVLLLFAIISCTTNDQNTKDNPISLIGKWHRWSTDNGYSEFIIDSQNVVVFNEKMGKSVLPYKIDNDSFRYTTIQYSAKIIPWGDSMIVLRTGDKVATLIRFKDSVDEFKGIPDEKDSIAFNLYKEKFYKRADKEWEKAGFGKGMGPDNDTILHVQ